MATVRKTILLSDEQDAWLAAQVRNGRHGSDSEVVGRLIEQEQERNSMAEDLRRALIEGERSGEPEAFDFAAFKRRKREEHG